MVLIAAVAAAFGAFGALLLARRTFSSSPVAGVGADVAGLREEVLRLQQDGLQQAVQTVAQVSREQFAQLAEAERRATEDRNASVTSAVQDTVRTHVETLANQLARVTSVVHEMEQHGAERLGELGAKLESSTAAASELAAVTDTLRSALTSTATRGQWGERMCDDVLRAAGFVEGINYHRQRSTDGAEGRGRPDVTFELPGGKRLHMDVKFPLDNYLRHLECDDDAEAERLADAFVRDVDQRIREVTTRAYIDVAGGTLDYVLLFLPNEHVYAFVHERSPDLIDRALGRKVVLCSPLTLFAVLSVIRQSVDAHVVEQRSGQILETLGAFQTQWRKFSEHVDKVGKQLATVQRTYDELAGVRRNQLVRQLDRIEDLRDDEARRRQPELVLGDDLEPRPDADVRPIAG